MICARILVVLCCVGTVVAQFQAWPNPSSTVKVPKTIPVNNSAPYDGGNVRFVAEFGDGSQSETQPPVFKLEDGATIKNVVLGAPAADGIHCLGSCTIENVWWEDVGEDAATFLGAAGATYMVTGGGAKKASDKVFQHDGGGTLTIQNFQVEIFGKLYRSCGNCPHNSKNLPRKVIIDTIKATGPGLEIAGVNYNYGDSATLKNIQISGKVEEVCAYYEGSNNESSEPPLKAQFGPTQDGDGTYCIYKKSDIKSS
ncbi:pectate lyase domain-containing protein [Ditylenchus destructor]|uniref:Probable pectate lyase F n=1 Tax=Ditylenchus destructor TaxID=166010 RepID=A0AAD4MTY0_9BILA|nr:pectate lyase domain-containing protein [Ditylenchus destructor]